jgi:tol-pal system protein YbgF
LPLALLASACAASNSATEQELSRMRRELHSLETQLAETKTELTKLDQRLTLLSAREGPRPREDAPIAAAPRAKTRVPSLPVVRLAASPAVEAETGAQDDGGPPVLIKVGPNSADKLSVDHEVLKHPDPVLGEIPPKADKSDKPAPDKAEKAEKLVAAKKRLPKAEQLAAKAEYDQALTLLREQHKPGEARAAFNAFKAHYPESELVANAAYWLAECTLAEGRHAAAGEEFVRVADEFPTSTKVPDALLRAGQSYLEGNDVAKASDLFKKVKAQYPGSDVATEADSALRAINERRPSGRP